jgi:dTMP kinase
MNKKFISFEGIDASGKTTQINLLKKYLEGRGETAHILREPGGAQISERIRGLLLDKKHGEMHERTELFLYSAARVQLINQMILPALEKGEYIIADRFVDSTTAYQGYGRGLDLALISQINEAATQGLRPFKTIYLQLSQEAAKQRRQQAGNISDRMESAGDQFYEKILAGYQKIAFDNQERIITIDATKSISEIHSLIIDKITNG